MKCYCSGVSQVCSSHTVNISTVSCQSGSRCSISMLMATHLTNSKENVISRQAVAVRFLLSFLFNKSTVLSSNRHLELRCHFEFVELTILKNFVGYLSLRDLVPDSISINVDS